jgi:hypothetical protein
MTILIILHNIVIEVEGATSGKASDVNLDKLDLLRKILNSCKNLK